MIDFKDGFRYLDLARPQTSIKINIEIDDKGTHGTNADSYKFSDDRFRQNDLVIDDWKVLRFSLQSIKEQPRRCQQQFIHALAKWSSTSTPEVTLSPIEFLIFRFIEHKTEAYSPSTIAKAVGIHRNKVIFVTESTGPIMRYRSNSCSY